MCVYVAKPVAVELRCHATALIFYYLPLQIWTLKICNHDISKTITARSFKLGQLIEDDEEIRIISLCRFGL